MEEKRKFVRLNVNVEVRWRKLQEDASMIVGKNSDISANGICLLVEERFEPQDKLQLELELPNQKIVKSVGNVVWVNQFGIVGSQDQRYSMGIEFIEISDEDKQELEKFVFSSLPKSKYYQ